MTCDDKALFKEAMDDVKPLKDPTNVVFLQHKPPRPQNRPMDDDGEDNFLIAGFVDSLPLECPLVYKRDGIQQGVLDKLRSGGYRIEASLNLTRTPVEACRRQLFAFVARMQREQLRTLLIIHGKGRHDSSHANIIRSFLARWLTQFEAVQAYCAALPKHGGSGACYVVLKKSPIASNANRERFARRGR
ncbi:DNA endonuclease SmrA [Martelella alba]|uniref:DNA endonuclease SmrA n=1 Tax=Martelella alba TaxID=2590451 RepID=A0ABY2SQQ3_9HYPH|nr:DNA endonuclease SmrA [Martelella alba]TKI08066.1 DNA endonuclease SmrA [Martelella alba]